MTEMKLNLSSAIFITLCWTHALGKAACQVWMHIYSSGRVQLGIVGKSHYAMTLHSASHRVLNQVPPHADNAQGHFVMTDAADRSRGCECGEDSCCTGGVLVQDRGIGWVGAGGMGRSRAGKNRAGWMGRRALTHDVHQGRLQLVPRKEQRLPAQSQEILQSYGDLLKRL